MLKFFSFVLGLVLLFSLITPAFAQGLDSEFPEQEGDYADPKRPGMRVRVFVHQPKHQPKQPLQPIVSKPVPDCLVDDPDSTAVAPLTGWHLPSTFTYTLNPGSAPRRVGAVNLATIASNSFSQWTNTVPGKVTITRNPFNTTTSIAKYDGKNIIAWGRVQALAVTTTWYWADGLVAESDTTFNRRYPWYWNAANSACTDVNSYDAQDVLTHELGHWMGLGDSYDAAFVNNTMYGYGAKGEVKKSTLTTGDKQGVQAVYP